MATVGSLENVVVRVTAQPFLDLLVTRAGRPVEGAEISIRGNRSQTVRTSQTGEARISGLLPGQYMVSACASDHRACSRERRVDVPLEETRLEMQLDADGAIAGVVQTGDQRPVAGVAVSCSRRGLSVDAISDAIGQFSCAGLPHGEYVVTAEPGGRAVKQLGALTVELAKNRNEAHGVILLVAPHTGALRGRVLDTVGNGVADAQVTVNADPKRTVRTNLQGAFEIGDLPDEPLVVSASEPTLGDARLTVLTIDRPVELVLRRRGAVEVVATGFTAAPVVRAQNSQTRTAFVGYREKGVYRFWLEAGEYVFTAVSRGGEGAAVKTTVPEVDSKTTVTLERCTLSKLSGLVRVFGSEQVDRSARCGAIPAVDGHVGAASALDLDISAVSEDGRFTLEVPSGELVVVCGSTLNGQTSLPSTGGASLLVELPGLVARGNRIGAQLERGSPFPQVFLEVAPESVAARAGLLPGDRLRAINGHSTQSVDAGGVQGILESLSGPTVLLVERGADSLSLMLDL